MTLILRKCLYPVTETADVEKALKGILIVSKGLMTPVAVLLSYIRSPDVFMMDEVYTSVQWWHRASSVILGLWSGLVIGVVTEYYTSHSHSLVREIAETQKQFAAIGIIVVIN